MQARFLFIDQIKIKVNTRINFSELDRVIKNPTGLWYYYQVGKADGFAEDCVLILGNVCTISQGRLLEKKGHLTCDISDENSLYRQLRKIIFSNVFEYEYRRMTDKIEKLELEKNNIIELEKNNS